VLVADGLEPEVEALGVLAGVGEEPERGAVGEVVVADEVDPSDLGLVDPRSSAAAWTMRSWKYIASVTRNEHR
jgi:hypothetical protein